MDRLTEEMYTPFRWDALFASESGTMGYVEAINDVSRYIQLFENFNSGNVGAKSSLVRLDRTIHEMSFDEDGVFYDDVAQVGTSSIITNDILDSETTLNATSADSLHVFFMLATELMGEYLDVAEKEEDGEKAALLLKDMMKVNKDRVLIWIQNTILEYIRIGCVGRIIGSFRMFMEFPYDALESVPEIIALACLNHKSALVKSAAFSLFDYWGNQKSLELLNRFEEPKEKWLRNKFHHLKQVIEKRCSI